MSDYEIILDRTHLFAPNVNVTISFQVTGHVNKENMEAAIIKAVKANEILNCKIVFADDGKAYYEKTEFQNRYIRWENLTCEEIIDREQRIPFNLPKGEFVRFFLSEIDEGISVLIIAHHLAGDGISITLLADDIMEALAGIKLTYKPMKLLKYDDLPKGSGLKGLMSFMLRIYNRQWEKSGKIFTWEDYLRMFDNYWVNRKNKVFISSIEPSLMKKILENAKTHNVPFNSVFITVAIRAMTSKVKVGIAADIRNDKFVGMGNYATGISIEYTYDTQKDFWENAAMVNELVYLKLDNKEKKYFLNHFMGSLAPTLVDSAYFTAFDGYKNRISKRFTDMFGYGKPNTGLSVTNLTTIKLARAYSGFEVKNFQFIPPLVSNGERIFGIVSHGGTLTISLHVAQDEQLEVKRKLFKDTIANLLEVSTKN